MYRNYIFDLYGTLVDIHTDEEKQEVWEKLSLFYGYYGAVYKPHELKKAYQCLADTGEYTHDSHEAYPEIQIEAVFRSLYMAKGISPSDELVLHTGQFFRVLTTKHLKLYEGVTEMLERLKRLGKKLYLLSNAQRIFTEYELRRLGIDGYFDGILISSDCGVKKPDPEFFKRLLYTYQLHSEECLMIGNDEQTDIAGASRMGMDTFYVHSNISPECRQTVQATYVQMEMNIGRLCETLGMTESQEGEVNR